jgi:hypothetical protein
MTPAQTSFFSQSCRFISHHMATNQVQSEANLPKIDRIECQKMGTVSPCQSLSNSPSFYPLPSLLTARLDSYLPATPPKSLSPPVRYTAGTVSLALFASLLYTLYALRNYTPLTPIGIPCLHYAYWLCVPPHSALALSHTAH